MLYFVSIVHVLLCVFMIFVILLQPGKDAGMGAALGGGAASSAFGGRGAVTFLGKVTAVCAIAYFVTSLGLSFVGLKGSVATTIAEKAAAEDANKKPPEAPKTDVKTTDTAKPAEGTAAPADGTAKPPEGAPVPQNPVPAPTAPPTNEVQKPSDTPPAPVPNPEEKHSTP
jgi:preprotein translocase subunit SecG